MSASAVFARRSARREIRHLPVQAFLEWAFGREKVRLEWPDERRHEERGFGFGMEYVLLQRARLGCRIDGGGSSPAHEDAEVAAAIVAGLPEALGGRRMAIVVAECARAGLTPDWMPGAEPRCVPREWRQTKHGPRAASVVVGRERVMRRGRWREVEVRACPITWDPHPRRIENARLAYSAWHRALCWLKGAFRESGSLKSHSISAALPPPMPWFPIDAKSLHNH